MAKTKTSAKKKATKKTAAKKPEDLTPDELTDKAMAEAEGTDPVSEPKPKQEPPPGRGVVKEATVIVSGKGMGRREMTLSEYKKLRGK